MPARKGGHEFFAEIGKTGLTNAAMRGIICLVFAGVAHLVERDLAKVEVASSSLVARSKKNTPSDRMGYSFWNVPRAGWNSLPRPARSASNPEVKAGLPRMALPFVGCREASSNLVYFAAQSAKNKEKPPFGRFFFLECAAAPENSLPRPARSAANRSVGDGVPDVPSARRCRAGNGFPRCFAPRSKCPWGTPRNDRGGVYRHAETIRQDGVSFFTGPVETPASGRAAPPAPRRSAPAGRPGRR